MALPATRLRLPGSPKRKRRYRTQRQGAVSRRDYALESEIVAFIPGYTEVDVVKIVKGKRALLASGAWVSTKVLDVLKVKAPSKRELEELDDEFALDGGANVERVEVRRPMIAPALPRPRGRVARPRAPLTNFLLWYFNRFSVKTKFGI